MYAHCPFTFIDVEDSSGCFSYFMNNRIQTDVPLKMIHVSLIHVINGLHLTNCYSVFRINLFEKW